MTDSGAHFFRCDFQVHTPRDAQWQGPRPATDDDRRAFAERLIAACRTRGLSAIAITDHHDFAFFRFIRDAADAETDLSGHPLTKESRLVVFPGVELTLGVPCQALMLLDPDFPKDRLDSILTRLSVEVTDPALPALGQVQSAEQIVSLKQLHDNFDELSWLRGRYIILPNVTDSGHQTLLRNGMHPKYKEMPCVGGYLDGPVSNLGRGNTAILNGEDAKWGNKAVALFQTSDSRSDTFEALGRHSTWVKWAVPSAEALRQACLARESRITPTAPSLPNLVLTRLSVSNSKFMGPIELELNSQYNAVIGGRGTGKSTILEYIRWALCDQQFPAVEAQDELMDLAARQQRLVSSTLAEFGAHVDVHLSINGIDHVVRRDATSQACQIRVAEEEFKPARESDVRALLPIHSYSQKQLSSVAIRLDELTRFVTAPIKAQLDALDAQSATIAAQLRQSYATVQRYRLLTNSVARLTLSEASLSQQAVNLRQSLDTVSDADRAVLERKPVVDQTGEAVDAWDRRLVEASDTVDGVVETLDSLIASLPTAPDDLVRQSDVAELRATSIAALTELRERLNSARGAFDQTRTTGTFDAIRAGWRQELTSFGQQYDAVKAASTVHESKLEELAAVEQRQREAQQQLASAQEELGRLGDPLGDYQRLRTTWRGISGGRSELLAQQCRELTRLSEGQIRAQILAGRGLNEISTRLRAAVAGSGVRTAAFDEFFVSLGRDMQPLASWELILSELEALIDSDPDAELTSEMIPTLARLGLRIGDVRRMVSRLTPDGWLEVALAPIADHPVFEYQRKEGEFIEFAVASAGQRATALLRILLNQAGPPLLIDQPEEDLDSQVIQEVVTALWKAKSNRQIIFASHNANLVVNGDAELVLCCDYRATGDQSGGHVKLQGAIDVEEVREEITRVMEGGEKAFRLRKEKYGF